MAKEVDNAFGIPNGARGLRETLIELDRYGSLAESLRSRFGLPSYAPRFADGSSLVGQGLSPIAASTRERDRLTVTAPLAVSAMLLSVQLALALWSRGVLSDLALPALSAIAGVSVLMLAMTLPALEKVLRSLARLGRTKAAKTIYEDLTNTRSTAGLALTHRGA